MSLISVTSTAKRASLARYIKRHTTSKNRYLTQSLLIPRALITSLTTSRALNHHDCYSLPIEGVPCLGRHWQEPLYFAYVVSEYHSSFPLTLCYSDGGRALPVAAKFTGLFSISVFSLVQRKSGKAQTTGVSKSAVCSMMMALNTFFIDGTSHSNGIDA